MDLVTSNYLPGDPRLIDQIVYELKSQGIFDQFRKECIADVDTKPAYQNLSQRVEGSVMNFLKKQKFSEDMNKNQLREQLRKNISESGFLETGVERIVDQVVNPKINTIFLPKVEDVVYRYLGIEKPNQDVKQDVKADVVDLLPNDLEAISPESVHDHSFNSNSEKKDESIETNENSLNSSNTKTEDESPPFELLEENTKFSMQEENSVDSHLSGISGLVSHESGHSTEIKDNNQTDISQDISQTSLNSEGNLSIVTSEEDTKMEICEDSNLSDNKETKKENSGNNDEIVENKIKEEKEIKVDETDVDKPSEQIENKSEETKIGNQLKIDEEKVDEKKFEDKKTNENKSDSKKLHTKYKSSRSEKDKKDDKDKRSRSKSESKSKDHKDSKSHSKHSSSSKDRDKEKKYNRNGKDKEEGSEKDKQIKNKDKERDKSKDKSNKSKEKAEKDRDRSEKDRDKLAKDKEKSDKERTYKDKSDKDRSDRVKEKSDREKNRPEKEKNKSDPDKGKSEKDKSDKDKLEKEKGSSSKHSKEKSSSSLKNDSSGREKDKSEDRSKDKSSSSKDKISFSQSSNLRHKESSNKDKNHSKTSKDKERSKTGMSRSKSNDKERKSGGDSKSRSSDKHTKSDKDKSSRHDKSNPSLKKDKDKKAVDDHYSLKDKKSERRSTDRDSNDGSSKTSRNGSFTESYSQSLKGSSKESSEVFSSGSGDSSNSDKMEVNTLESLKDIDIVDVVKGEAPQSIKYIKPKFASNIHEAMKIMKIRKQLAKLERQNQLSLAHVQGIKDSQNEPKDDQHLKGLSIVLEKSPMICNPAGKVDDLNNKEKIKSTEYNQFKAEQLMLPDKQLIKNEETGSPTKIIYSNSDENITTKGRTNNSEEFIADESPMLKSQDLSMESFEALEARLAQEMSNVNYHMYGDEDDNYEYSSVSLSPVKKRKAYEEAKPSIKKILFDTSNAKDNDDEIELVVSKQIEECTEEIKNDTDIPIIISDLHVEHHYDVTDQIEVPSEEMEVLSHENSNIIIENGEELVIDEVHEEHIDYSQETIINDTFDDSNIAVFKKQEGLEKPVECIRKTVLPKDIYEECDIEVGKIQLDNHTHFENKDNIKLNDVIDEFRGFDIIDRDNANVIKFIEKIFEMENNLEKLNNTYKSHIARCNNISVFNKMVKEKFNSPRKEDRIILKHGLSLEATFKVTNVSSTIQDLLQKNGKKLFIKIDKLEYELPSRVLVSLQGMETNGMNNPVCEVNNVSHEDGVKNRQEIKKEFEQEYIAEAKTEESQVCNGEETKQNGKIFSESPNTSEIVFCNSNSNSFVEREDYMRSHYKWEDDGTPCYYFDQSDSVGEEHLKILNDMIGRLEKAVEKQSLQIQNNVPSIKKRGRKRKAQSTENNNSISAQCKSEPKRKHLSDSTSNQNGGNLCNTNISQNQSFSLPLSPADSDKSEEHKKEEPVTVKTKRTGRVSNNKRYSSEDLYKPRPVLRYGSTRRRGAKSEEHKP